MFNYRIRNDAYKMILNQFFIDFSDDIRRKY